MAALAEGAVGKEGTVDILPREGGGGAAAGAETLETVLICCW